MELLHHLERLGLSPQVALAVTQLLITVTVAIVLIALARWTAAQLKAGARWLRVAVGCRSVPAAPGGGLLNLGHALQLARAPCPWEKMLEWARATGPLTRFNILHRTGLIVNDAEGAKRVFQVGLAGCPAGRAVLPQPCRQPSKVKGLPCKGCMAQRPAACAAQRIPAAPARRAAPPLPDPPAAV